MINARHLRECVIRPTLKALGRHSAAAENLLMGTAAQESHLGEYLVQLNGGPALGIYQMEPATHNDIIDRWLVHKMDLFKHTKQSAGVDCFSSNYLTGNLVYATVMARLHYLRVSAPLPAADDLDGLARYWKRYWNTELGAGTEAQFIGNYLRFVEVGR